MTRTGEIADSAASAGRAIGDAKGRAAAALRRAHDLMEEAAGHGWEGVAASMRSAADALEAVVAHLGDAEDVAEATVAALGEVKARPSTSDVAEQLGSVLHQFGRIRSGVDAAASGVAEAVNACHQSGQPRELLDLLRDVSDRLDGARQTVEVARGGVESERQQAASWGS